MFQSVWHFGGYILDESSTEGDVEELGSAADRKEWQFHLLGGPNESDLGFITCAVWLAAVRRTGLSIQRRLYIFAAGEKKSVDAGENRADGIVAGQRWDDKWYQSCTFKCGDVGGVESHAMKVLVAGISGR
jgi:hypothetical protein